MNQSSVTGTGSISVAPSAVGGALPPPPPSLTDYGSAINASYSITAPGGLSASNLPAGWTIVAKSDPSQQSDGFSAVVLKDASGNIIIAYEGTQFGASTPAAYQTGVAGADAAISAGQPISSIAALQDSIQFANQVQLANPSTPIYVTGHSLGGTEAEAAAQSLGENCAGGVTLAATGLPGNSDVGPSGQVNPITGVGNSLTDYVERGDPVANYASDPGGPMVSIAPDNVAHYGYVSYIGSQDAATDLQSLSEQIHTLQSGSMIGTECSPSAPMRQIQGSA